MKTIGIVTSTRAEFGLLLPLIKQLRNYESNHFVVELIVTGTHLSQEYGNTIREIEDNNIRIDVTIPISTRARCQEDISNNQADALVKFTKLFLKKNYSGIVILGDRYEMLSVAIAAGNTSIPIFHICGGDTTEGAIDEWIRHSITKMSYLHFPSNEESYKRIVQMGESPDRVFNFGSTSIDNILNMAYGSKKEALKSIGLNDCKYALCTYHPVTMENDSVHNDIDIILKVIRSFPMIRFVITKSNADKGGTYINKKLDEVEDTLDNVSVFSSLGSRRYLSLMKYSEFIIGNSSSGIIEAPILEIPTINIGDRQRGRLRTDSIIDCNTDEFSISCAIKIAMSSDFKAKCKAVKKPYGDGHASEKIAHKIVETIENDRINLKKSFYNINI